MQSFPVLIRWGQLSFTVLSNCAAVLANVASRLGAASAVGSALPAVVGLLFRSSDPGALSCALSFMRSFVESRDDFQCSLVYYIQYGS